MQARSLLRSFAFVCLMAAAVALVIPAVRTSVHAALQRFLEWIQTLGAWGRGGRVDAGLPFLYSRIAFVAVCRVQLRRGAGDGRGVDRQHARRVGGVLCGTNAGPRLGRN